MKKCRQIWLCLLSLLLLVGCSTEEKAKQSEQQQNVIVEYNRLGEQTYSAVDVAQSASLAQMDELLQLYLYNTPTQSIESLFKKPNVTNTEDNENSADMLYKTFFELKESGESIDAYDRYLEEYAQYKGIRVSEIPVSLRNWEALTETEKEQVANSPQDFSDFFAWESVVTVHDYFTRMGSSVVYEIIVITGKSSEQLSVVISWSEGKIVDVTRMYKG